MFGKDNKEKIREFIDGSEDLKEIKSISLREVVSGEVFTKPFVTKKLSYVLFVAFLAFCYIANHYKVESLLTELTLMKKELKELRSEAITTASELMQISKQSQVERRLHEEGIDLEPLSEPPRVLEVD
ncbi:MAG: FtsL-like putative cell division protein [Breznakibacter sp.]